MQGKYKLANNKSKKVKDNENYIWFTINICFFIGEYGN